jgi:hypothetical protein
LKPLFYTIAAGLALAGAALPVQAGQPAQKLTPTVAKSAVLIPFNPPLNVPQRYRVSKSKLRNGAVLASGSFVERISFSKSANGYVMQWKMEPDGEPSGAAQDPAAALIAQIWAEPVAFDINADGTILRARDWPAVQARLQKTLDAVITTAVAKESPDQVAEMRAAMNSALAPLFGGSAEQAPANILKNLNPALGWGGSSFTDGDTVTNETLVPTPLSAIPLKASVVTRIGPVAPGETITIISETQHDPAVLSAAMKDFFGRILASMPADQRAKAEATMPKDLSVDLVDKSKFVIDLKTGLPMLFTNERAMTMAGQGGGGETLKVERLP